MAAVSKKRTVGEITKPNGGSSSGKKTIMQGKSAAEDSSAATLWIEKHAPRSVDEVMVNKKKVGEFTEIAEKDGGGGFLVL